MKNFCKRARVLAALAVLLLFCACASVAEISEELSPAEIIQRAQEASDRNRYGTALAVLSGAS